jgi:hypothetical protein
VNKNVKSGNLSYLFRLLSCSFDFHDANFLSDVWKIRASCVAFQLVRHYLLCETNHTRPRIHFLNLNARDKCKNHLLEIRTDK